MVFLFRLVGLSGFFLARWVQSAKKVPGFFAFHADIFLFCPRAFSSGTTTGAVPAH